MEFKVYSSMKVLSSLKRINRNIMEFKAKSTNKYTVYTVNELIET